LLAQTKPALRIQAGIAKYKLPERVELGEDLPL
jgi:hypothetical protein